jgi:putative inorganic carbon (HCO3(-)) transporter
MLKIFSFNMLNPSGGKIEKFLAVLNFSIPLLMGVYIFFNPFPHTTAIKEFCFYISFLALITLIFFKKTNFSLRSPLTLPFVLFLLWGIFGLFFALDLANSLHDIRAHFVKYLLIYYLLVNYFNSSEKLEILSWIVISSATIFSLWATIDYYLIAGNPFARRLGETFLEIHTDYIGFVLIFALTLTLNKLLQNNAIIVKYLLVISAFILCLTTLLTQSRGSLIALLVAIIIFSCFNKKILILLLISILLVIIIPGFKERTDPKTILQNERLQMNALTMEIIKTYPLAGIGFGMQIYGNEHLVDLKTFDSRLPKKHQGGVGGRFIGSPHNTLLDIAVRTGIIGLMLFLSVILTTIWMLWKAGRSAKSEYFKSWIICISAAFASFVIAALFADTTFGPQAIVFYTILAMITILWNMIIRDKSENNAA